MECHKFTTLLNNIKLKYKSMKIYNFENDYTQLNKFEMGGENNEHDATLLKREKRIIVGHAIKLNSVDDKRIENVYVYGVRSDNALIVPINLTNQLKEYIYQSDGSYLIQNDYRVIINIENLSSQPIEYEYDYSNGDNDWINVNRGAVGCFLKIDSINYITNLQYMCGFSVRKYTIKYGQLILIKINLKAHRLPLTFNSASRHHFYVNGIRKWVGTMPTDAIPFKNGSDSMTFLKEGSYKIDGINLQTTDKYIVKKLIRKEIHSANFRMGGKRIRKFVLFDMTRTCGSQSTQYGGTFLVQERNVCNHRKGKTIYFHISFNVTERDKQKYAQNGVIYISKIKGAN